MEAHLPFPLRGLDCANGGEFINHHLVKHLKGRARHVALRRSRPHRKNDNAHVEQNNYTQERQWFGHEHYGISEVWPLVNALSKGR